MAKKKTSRRSRAKARKKRVKKVKKVKRVKKKVASKRAVSSMKKAVGSKQKAELKEKILGMVDHFFGRISVAAIKVKAPIKVGDVIHVKGHTTDFSQRVDSMQIEHQNVEKAKKGDDIGVKVKDKVRQYDIVYLAASEKGITAQPLKPSVIQQPIFPPKIPPAERPESKSSSPYSDKKFFQF